MAAIVKKKTRQLAASRKIDVLLQLIDGGTTVHDMEKLNAPELRALRDYLLEQAVYLQEGDGVDEPQKNQIVNKFETIPNYYHKQACREPLDACYNETCMASNPICFSRKMNGQIAVVLQVLSPFFKKS